MIQRKRSFENQLINLFWGLTRGSRLLKPYSDEFKKLGFKIVGFELPFYAYNRSRKAAPDMILESIKLQESVITEWTQEQEISDKKRDQIKRYSKIDEDSLKGFVSEVCVKNRDFILIVTPDGEASFREFITDEKLPVILFVYNYPREYLLEKILNTFSIDETERFFSQPLKFNRIHYSFPDINLSDLSHSLLVDNVVSTLVEILVKQDEGFVFDIELFTRKMLTLPFYSLLSGPKRGKITQKTKEIINKMAQKGYLRGILNRINNDPPTWEIILPNSQKFRKIISLKNKLEKFAAEIAGRPYLPSLFEQSDESGGPL